MKTAAQRQKDARARKKAGNFVQINMWISPKADQTLRLFAEQHSLSLNSALIQILINAPMNKNLAVDQDRSRHNKQILPSMSTARPSAEQAVTEKAKDRDSFGIQASLF